MSASGPATAPRRVPPGNPDVRLPPPASPIYSFLVLGGAALLLLTLLFPWTVVAVNVSSGSEFLHATADFDSFSVCLSESSNAGNHGFAAPSSPPLHQGHAASPLAQGRMSSSPESARPEGASNNGSNNNSGNNNPLVPGECLAYAGLAGSGGGSQGLEFVVLLLAAGAVLLLLGVALAAAGAILGLRTGSAPATRKGLKKPYSLTRSGAVLALVGGLILFVILTLVTGFLVGPLCNGGNGGGGPNFSPMGSCAVNFGGSSGGGGGGSSGSNATGTVSWGPSTALFLDLGGFALLLVGSLGLRSYWKREAAPDTAGARSPTPTAPSEEVQRLRQELEAIKAQMSTAAPAAPSAPTSPAAAPAQTHEATPAVPPEK